MREILFRGKRCDNGEWVEGYYFTTPLTDESTGSKPEEGWFFLTGKTRHVISRNSCVYEVIPETVGQYTGLKDKNGVKIFEGDILNSIFKYNNTTHEITGVVEEDKCNPCFVIHYKWDGDKQDCYEYDFIQCNLRKNEIIGNIHDNPELFTL